MKYYYMITVQIAYKEKEKEVGIEDIFPSIYSCDNLVTFNAPTLHAIERQAVKEYYEKNKIDIEMIEKANSQVLAISYLGQMKTFNPVPKKEEIN